MNKYIQKQDGGYVKVLEKEAILQKGKLIVLQYHSVIILGRYPNQATATMVLKKIEEWRHKGLVNIFAMPIVQSGFLHPTVSHPITHTDGRAGSRLHTKWTQKGRLFINNILNNRGIYADMELLQLTA